MSQNPEHIPDPDPESVSETSIDQSGEPIVLGLRAEEVLALPAFVSLLRQQRLVSLGLTALMLLLYFGFILLIAWRKDLLAIRLGEHLTLGLPMGLGLILLTCLLTGVYVSWANRIYDPQVKALLAQIGGPRP